MADYKMPIMGNEKIRVKMWDVGRDIHGKPWHEWVFVMWSQSDYGIEGIDSLGCRHFINTSSPSILVTVIERYG